MDNKKAIDLLNMIKFENAECNLGTWYHGIDGDMKEALEIAIKALEQEPVYYPPCIDCNKKMNEIRNAYDNITTKVLKQESILDKIRDEIEQLPTSRCTETCRIYIYADDFMKNVLEIIDKYRAESEGE